MPFMAQVALGKKPVLTIFGNDYNTPDGTGIIYLNTLLPVLLFVGVNLFL